MEWVEASGKSLVEAREHALDLLGVAEDDAEIVVVSEPRPGLFGRMRGEARVQARVRPVAPPPKRGRSQRERRGASGNGAGGGRGGRGGRGAAAGEGQGQGQGQGGRGSGPKTAVVEQPEAGASGATAPESGGGPRQGGAGGGSGRNRRRRGSGRPAGSSNGTAGSTSGKGAATTAAASGMAETQQAGATGDAGRQEIAPRESEDQMEERLTLEEQGEAARVFVAGLLEQFGVAADVGTRTLDEETVEVTATGSDLGLLVGPRGATLAAVQDLARTVVQRQSVSRTDRILVDIGGYREKRSAALRRFTQGVAEEVLASGTERALEPMSAADRKVVHDTVNEIDGVQTRSEGEEPRRYIVIELAD